MLDLQVSNQGLDVLAVISQADHLARSTRRNYRAVMERYLDTGAGLLDAAALAHYAQGLSGGTRKQLKAAVKLVIEHAREQMNAAAAPDAENVVELEARMAQVERRLDAVESAVKVTLPKGQKTHTWLNQAQVKALLNECGGDLQGERDRLALGLLVAAGLRRDEAVNLTFGDVKQQPIGEEMRTVLAIEGKGKKRRTVPISPALAGAIERWGRYVGHTGRVLRSFDQRGELNGSLSDVALFKLVRRYGEAIGKPKLAPHDLRRTYAQLGYEAGVPIVQISTLLGHASVATTQRYLNLALDLETTVSDFIPFEVAQ